MISVEDAKTLNSLLKAEHRSLDEIITDFYSRFSNRTLHFRLCSSLAILLQDKKMLSSTQRLIAFTILHQTYSSKQFSANPFMTLIVNAASDDEAEKYERAFIHQLLGSGSTMSSKEFLKQSAADYITGFDPSLHVLLQREQLQQQYCDKTHPEPYNCLFKNVAIKNVVPDPDVPRGCDANSPEFDIQLGAKPKVGSGDRDETVTGLLANMSLEGLGPQWVRPLPPRLPIQDGELVWLHPDDTHELIWDYGMCADTSRGAAVRDFISKALKGPLAPAQQEEIT